MSPLTLDYMDESLQSTVTSSPNTTQPPTPQSETEDNTVPIVVSIVLLILLIAILMAVALIVVCVRAKRRWKPANSIKLNNTTTGGFGMF